MTTNPVSYGAAAAAASTSSSSGVEDPGKTKEEFISLLVAQLQNQDPTNPTDGTQFLSQLTEINSLEQLLGIRQDLDSLSAPATTTSGTQG